MTRIGLVGCVKTKLDTPAPAADLYISPLFRKRRAYVEHTCDSWYILSALHGLVAPDTIIDPYDHTLIGQPLHVKRAWASFVIAQLETAVPLRTVTVEVHAGGDYTDYGLTAALRMRGVTVERPAGRAGIGAQLHFYTQHATA